MTPIRLWNWLVDAKAVLYFMCVIGMLSRFSCRAGEAFREKVNLYPTRRCYWSRNYDIFVLRSLVGVVFFSGWVAYPGALSWLLINVYGVAPGFANYLTIPPTAGTAVVAGILSDSGITEFQARLRSRFPNLSRIIAGEFPSYNPDIVDMAKLKQENK